MKKFRTFDKMFYFFLILFILLLILSISILPQLIIKSSIFNVSDKNQIGNSFSSFVGTFVAMIAAFLIIIAFWVQYKANVQQREIFKDQRKDIQIERFQNKFYELMNLHNDNVKLIVSGASSKHILSATR